MLSSNKQPEVIWRCFFLFFFSNDRCFLNVLRSIIWKVRVQVMVSLSLFVWGVHETHGNTALSKRPWEKTTEVAICQPLQDPPLCQRSFVHQWTCFCLTREKDHSSLGQRWAILPEVKAVKAWSLKMRHKEIQVEEGLNLKGPSLHVQFPHHW